MRVLLCFYSKALHLFLYTFIKFEILKTLHKDIIKIYTPIKYNLVVYIIFPIKLIFKMIKRYHKNCWLK